MYITVFIHVHAQVQIADIIKELTCFPAAPGSPG